MKAIELISIPVSDQEKAKDFYVNKLGFQLIAEAPFDNNQRWIQVGLPDGQVSVTLVTWFPKMLPGCVQGILIETDNIDNDAKLLKAKGIHVGDIDNTPWGKFVSFSDPDGNGWSLHQK